MTAPASRRTDAPTARHRTSSANPTAGMRPSRVLVGLAGVVGAFALVSWTANVPTSTAVFRSSAVSATDAPSWVQELLSAVAEAGILALAALVLVLTWRARSTGVPAVARAVVASGGVVAAYASSEVLKLLFTQPRPCATVAVEVLAECPSPGDWSLPSNHATIAAALATAVVLLAPRWAVPAVLTAVAVAGARVATGVHYPHDVVTGLLLGATVVALTTVLCDRVGRAAVRSAASRWPVIIRRA